MADWDCKESARPTGRNVGAIGCVSRWNKKAWLRSGSMAEWLCSFYQHIGRQRRVLLLLDNFSAHLCALDDAPRRPILRLFFFPVDATSIYQPLDQGIIQNLKHHYRKKWKLWMINVLDRNIDPRERMSLNYTLRWLAQVWRNDVSGQTIQNCFNKSTVTSRIDKTEDNKTKGGEAFQLGDIYQSLTNNLTRAAGDDAQEFKSLDESLDPPDENDTYKPDLSDIILDLSGRMMTNIYLGLHLTFSLMLRLLVSCMTLQNGLSIKKALLRSIFVRSKP